MAPPGPNRVKGLYSLEKTRCMGAGKCHDHLERKTRKFCNSLIACKFVKGAFYTSSLTFTGKND